MSMSQVTTNMYMVEQITKNCESVQIQTLPETFQADVLALKQGATMMRSST